jgi:hypothetical protein
MSRREDYVPGRKVRFTHMRDANLWSVGDSIGTILSTSAYGPTESMIIVVFKNRRAHVSNVLLTVLDE